MRRRSHLQAEWNSKMRLQLAAALLLLWQLATPLAAAAPQLTLQVGLASRYPALHVDHSV